MKEIIGGLLDETVCVCPTCVIEQEDTMERDSNLLLLLRNKLYSGEGNSDNDVEEAMSLIRGNDSIVEDEAFQERSQEERRHSPPIHSNL